MRWKKLVISSLISTIIATTITITTAISPNILFAKEKLYLPIPNRTNNLLKSLTEEEAILLAIRNNPDVLNARLQVVTNKWALEEEYDKFHPKYTLGLSEIFNKDEKPQFTATANSSIKLKTGTDISVGYGNIVNPDGKIVVAPKITIKQPLLQGFGVGINTIDLRNAEDQEIINRLTYRDAIATVVTTVLQDYRALKKLEGNEQIQKNTEAQQLKQLKQQKLLYSVGRISYNQYLQNQQTLIEIQTTRLSNKSSLEQMQQKLLTDLNLDPNSNLRLVTPISVKKILLPSKATCMSMAFQENTTYRSALNSVTTSERSLRLAKNKNLPDLSVTANSTLNISPSEVNNKTGLTGESAVFSVDVPLQNQDVKKGIITAKISLMKAKQGLLTAHQTVISTINQDFQSIENDYTAIKQGDLSVYIDKKTLKGIRIQYQYGQIAFTELNQQIQKLLADQQAQINNRVTLLNHVDELRQYIGTTLKHWHISLRY